MAPLPSLSTAGLAGPVPATSAGQSAQTINNDHANNSIDHRNLSKKEIEELQNKRDAFVTAMRTLSLAAETAARSGYDYFNTLISHSGFPERVTSNAGALAVDPLSYNAHVLARAVSVVPEASTGAGGSKGHHDGDEDGKKKRKKKVERDPDAPKKPLTPYFAFFQDARPQIVRDLGGKATLQQLNDICGRMWREMGTAEQKLWQAKYQAQMLIYQANMNAYRAERGLPPLKETKAAQKRNLAAFLEAAEAQEADEDADAEDHEDHQSPLEDIEEEREEEEVSASTPPPPPPPAKKVKTGTIQKPNGAAKPPSSSAENMTTKSTPAPEPDETVTESPLPAKRNRKNSKKKEEADAASAEVAKTRGKNKDRAMSASQENAEDHSIIMNYETGSAADTPKSKEKKEKRSRKRKSEVLPSDEQREQIG